LTSESTISRIYTSPDSSLPELVSQPIFLDGKKLDHDLFMIYGPVPIMRIFLEVVLLLVVYQLHLKDNLSRIEVGLGVFERGKMQT